MSVSVNIKVNGKPDGGLQYFDGGIEIPKEIREKIASHPEVNILWEVITTETVGTVTITKQKSSVRPWNTALIIPEPTKDTLTPASRQAMRSAMASSGRMSAVAA